MWMSTYYSPSKLNTQTPKKPVTIYFFGCCLKTAPSGRTRQAERPAGLTCPAPEPEWTITPAFLARTRHMRPSIGVVLKPELPDVNVGVNNP